jgi:hypothetical protein
VSRPESTALFGGREPVLLLQPTVAEVLEVSGALYVQQLHWLSLQSKHAGWVDWSADRWASHFAGVLSAGHIKKVWKLLEELGVLEAGPAGARGRRPRRPAYDRLAELVGLELAPGVVEHALAIGAQLAPEAPVAPAPEAPVNPLREPTRAPVQPPLMVSLEGEGDVEEEERSKRAASPYASGARQHDGEDEGEAARELGELVDRVHGVLAEALEWLGPNDHGRPWPRPRRNVIRRALAKHPVAHGQAVQLALEAKATVTAEWRAPNIAGLYAFLVARYARERAEARDTIRRSLADAEAAEAAV